MGWGQVPSWKGEQNYLTEGLPFLVAARQRVKLPEGDLGPRTVVVVGHTAYTAN